MYVVKKLILLYENKIRKVTKGFSEKKMISLHIFVFKNYT